MTEINRARRTFWVLYSPFNEEAPMRLYDDEERAREDLALVDACRGSEVTWCVREVEYFEDVI